MLGPVGASRTRILFLSDNFPPEGNAPASRLWEHATRWAAAGLDALLAAAERLRHRPEVVVLLAGPGVERPRLERAIAERRIGNVRLLPCQAKERMPQRWSLCDLAVVPLRGHGASWRPDPAGLRHRTAGIDAP